MSDPAKGFFGDLQSMSLSDWLTPFSGINFEHKDATREEIAEAAFILDQEYRGNGFNLDETFIGQKIRKTVTKKQLKNFD